MQERRDIRKLGQIYKIQKGICPETLTDIVPPTRERTNYLLRRGSQTSLVKARTQTLMDSYIPGMIKEWNKLPEQIRSAGTIEQFKNHIMPDRISILGYIYEGDRNT